jgi:hypothetical protein
MMIKIGVATHTAWTTLGRTGPVRAPQFAPGATELEQRETTEVHA